MTWNPLSGTFTVGRRAATTLPGVTFPPTPSGNYVTVQDLIDFGLLAGVHSVPTSEGLRAAIKVALEDSAMKITANSSNLIQHMNGAAGVVIGSAGIAAYDSTGAATVTIDAETGAVTLVGTITASAGAIGGFDIGADYIRDAANTFGLASTVTGGNDARFWAGDTFANRDIAPVRIYENGFAVLGGVALTSANIYERDTNNVTAITMNFLGYDGGTTQFRNFNIYDGKSAAIATFTGSTKAVAFSGPVTATTFTGNVSGSSASCTGLAGSATNIVVTDSASDTTCWPLLALDQTGVQGARTDAGLTYNSSTNVLTAVGFVGSLTGTASLAASAGALGGVTAESWCRTLNGDSGSAAASSHTMSITTTVSGYTVVASGSNCNYEAVSDRRLKEKIEAEAYGLDFINQLLPVSYHRIDEPRRHHGFIAQDVERLVKHEDDALYITNPNGTLGVDYVALIAPLVKAVQELSATVEGMK